MWRARHEPEKAIASIQRALKLADGDPQRVLAITQEYLQILASAKKYAELVSECGVLLQNQQVAERMWWVYQMRGVGQAHLGHADEAEKDFDTAVRVAAATHNFAASSLVMQSMADSLGAEAAIGRAKERAAGGDPHWNLMLAYLYFTREDFGSAAAAVEKVLAAGDALPPADRETALSVAGSVYMRNGNIKKAEAAYQQLLTVNADDAVALNNLACIYAEHLDAADPQRALKYAERAYDLMSRSGRTDANLLDTYGWVLVLSGRVDEGVQQLRSALQRGETIDVRYHLGAALLKQGDATAGAAELKKAQALVDAAEAAGKPVDAKLKGQVGEAMKQVQQK
jgi:tetratricopeptide (TPR) repeat protein